MKTYVKDMSVLSFAKFKKSNGFTLIEVMAAVAVFAVSSIGLYSLNSQTINVAAQLETKTLAHWLAMNALVEVEMTGEIPEAGQDSKNESFGRSEWDITTVISDTAVDEVKRVTVTVRFDGEEAEQARLVGFIGAKELQEKVL